MNTTVILTLALVLVAVVAAPVASASLASSPSDPQGVPMKCFGPVCDAFNYVFCDGHPLHVACVA